MSRSRSRRESILLTIRVIFFVAVLIAAAIIEYRVRDALDDPAAYPSPAVTTTSPAPAEEVDGQREEDWIKHRGEQVP